MKCLIFGLQGQIDGNVVFVRSTLPPSKKPSPPPKPAAMPTKRDSGGRTNIHGEGEKDGIARRRDCEYLSPQFVHREMFIRK